MSMEESWVKSVSGQRWVEVEAYAIHRGITAEEAVTELINKGLSHLDPDEPTRRYIDQD